MVGSGEKERETIRPEFDRSIMIDFQGAKITSDTGFLLLRAIDERFGILGPLGTVLEDTRSWIHSKHSLLQMARQRIYQIAAGYEDCNDADFLRIDPALRLAIGKDNEAGAGQSRLSRLENEDLGTEAGLKALEDALMRSNDALMKRKKKQEADRRRSFNRRPCPRQKRERGVQRSFREELLSPAVRLHRRRGLPWG